MKLTLISTILNGEKEIKLFLESIIKQSLKPDEVIIVDGGSSDKTPQVIEKYISDKKIKNLKLISKKGNISIGRNTAIKKSKNEIILCSDADCVLDKDWIKNISSPFKDNNINIVSGFYKPTGKTVFQKCLGVYTSIMPDRVNEEEFLPSSRSIAFKKNAWKKIGGYPEWLDRGEDLYFAKKLKEKYLKFKFVKNAIVYWPQRENVLSAFKQFLGYAIGDARALNLRDKVILVFLRYFLGIYLLFLSFIEKSELLFFIIFLSLILYICWSIFKNYKYVKRRKSILILPTLQFTADIAILIGTIIGLLKRITLLKIKKFVYENKFILTILVIYVIVILSSIRYAAPGYKNPYPLNMDEWHQFQAIRTTVAYGTPNMFGSANGTMLHFIISAIYLVPFTLIGYINPINLPVTDLLMRDRIFELLRINTLIFGSLSIIAIYIASKKLKISYLISVLLFVSAPIWINLSGYFKYDIALMFFIIVTLIAFIIFIKNPTSRNFYLCSIFSALAFCIKVSAIPFIPILIFSFFWYFKNSFKNLKILLIGCLVYLGVVILFGIPDTVFGNGNIILFLKENIIGFPSIVKTLNLGMDPRLFLYFKQYPIIFGHGLYFLFIFSFCVLLSVLFKAIKNNDLKSYKFEIFILFSFSIFFISLIPLNLFAGGNKSLVLLPFIVLLIGIIFERSKYIFSKKNIYLILVLIVLMINITETFLWINLKRFERPQDIASVWIMKNISKGTEIGLENIPIYQAIPDLLNKEFYFKQDGFGKNNIYNYKIIDANSKILPKVIVISNGDIESLVVKDSVKKKLIERLITEGYKREFYIKSKKPYKMSDIDYHFSWINFNPTSLAVYIKK